MANISAKINLRQLKNVVRSITGKNGNPVECLIIPIKENNLFFGEKGIYLDLQAFELKDRKPDQKDTHIVKQSFPKEVFDKMSEQEKKDMPILGNMILWGRRESDPVNFETIGEDPVIEGTADDLPF